MSAGRVLSRVIKIALAAALIAAVSIGCGGAAVDVTVRRVGPRAIEETVMVAGNLAAANPTQVMPLVSGPVAQVFVEEGQEVAAGQALLQLDTNSLEQSLLSAQASLESIQGIAGVFDSLSSSASSIGNAMESILECVDSGVKNLYDFEKSLVTVLPEDLRFEALQRIDASYREYLTKKQNMPSISVGAGGMSTGAQQAAADKAIENAQRNLEAATIKAPVSGTLISTTTGGASLESLMSSLLSSFSGMIPSGLNLSSLTGLAGGLGAMGLPSAGPIVPGSYIMPGSPIFTIVDLKNMQLIAKVDEADIAKVRTGQKAVVSLEAYPDRRFEGNVVKVANTATTNEAGATAFDVTVLMEPSEVRLKVGMTGTADITVATKKSAVVIPVEALLDKKGKKYVFKVEDGKAGLTEVALGLVTESSVEITSGVEFGDLIVTRGVEKLKDGQSVKTDSK